MEKVCRISNIFLENNEETLLSNLIEIEKPLNEVKKIRNFIESIFERLEDKGHFKFHYNHYKKNKKTNISFMNILLFIPIHLGILPFKKRTLSNNKLSEILFKSGFNIIEVKKIGEYNYYVASKDILLTI